MKITRYKRVQRYLNFYRNHFAFRPPYQVLVDGTFCQAALKNKINIKEQMPKYLNDEIKMMTTICVVKETESLGPALFGAMLVVKQFQVAKCGHEKNPIAAVDCLFSLVNGSDDQHFILATQDRQLTNKVRSVPGHPILYMKLSAMVMEKPSQISERFAEDEEKKQVEIPKHQIEILETLKRKKLGSDVDKTERRKRKKKGPSGPNPLSCKKKKKEKKADGADEKSGHKRKRKRHKMAKHMKRMLARIEANNS